MPLRARGDVRWLLLAGLVLALGALTVGLAPMPDPASSRATTVAPSSSTTAIQLHSEPRDRSAPPTPSPTPVPILPGQPPLAIGIRAQLDCDGASRAGAEVPDFEVDPGAASARAAIEQLIDVHYVPWLPLRGYVIQPLGDHWARLVYAPHGRTKALVVLTDALPLFGDADWHVVGLVACPVAEFEPTDGLSTGDATWTDARGRPVAPDVVQQRGDCYGGIRLLVGGRLYVRDPRGTAYEPEQLLTTYDGDVALPRDAIVTTYREGDRRLFLVADRSVVYVADATGAERWPRVRGDAYERIDCN